MSSPSSQQPVRLDKWLRAARFYKTRLLATEAVNGGHVHVNGQRGKPSKVVHLDDEIVIRKDSVKFEIKVTGLSDKRGSAQLAQALYIEHPHSLEQRELERLQRRSLKLANPHPSRRPDKRQRRQLKAWQDQS
jgi:ribosome-associated heat shock protein Hsp15